ncbi:hypothetical protein ACOMHN_023865 [Nucella lapillus]
MVVGLAIPDSGTYAQVTATGTDSGGGMAAKHQHDTRGVSPPQQHAVGQDRVDQHENSPSHVNAGRHGISPSRVNAGRHGNFPSRVNAGRHGISPSRVNAGRHEVKASRPSDEANCASGGGGFFRETRAGADQPLHSGSDGRRASHSSDAGLSLTSAGTLSPANQHVEGGEVTGLPAGVTSRDNLVAQEGEDELGRQTDWVTWLP